jgi:hypothetical protein
MSIMQPVKSEEARHKPVGIDRDKMLCRLPSVYGDVIIRIVSHACKYANRFYNVPFLARCPAACS